MSLNTQERDLFDSRSLRESIQKENQFIPVYFILDCGGHDSPGHELQDEEQVPPDRHVYSHHAAGCRKAGQVHIIMMRSGYL